ncbi:MAG: hypothetical protein WC525_05335 [Candidatus Thermoplasmatota archaeon]
MTRNHFEKKILAVGIILVLIGITGIPSTAEVMGKDDTTPPVTTCTLNPPEPDGQNGWYVNNVTVTLSATDNESGVNITKYRIDEAAWETYTEPVLLTNDGNDILLEYFSIDVAGNIEPVKNVTVDIDSTKPVIWLEYTWEKVGDYYVIIMIADCSDAMSGMERVEFYLNDVLQETVIGPGPRYEWIFVWPPPLFGVTGLICNLEITDEYVKFYAILLRIFSFSGSIIISSYAYDKAGNRDYAGIMDDSSIPAPIVPGIYLFQDVTLPNHYTGHVGRFFIKASFSNT